MDQKVEIEVQLVAFFKDLSFAADTLDTNVVVYEGTNKLSMIFTGLRDVPS